MINLADHSFTGTDLPDFVDVGKYSTIARHVIFHPLFDQHLCAINHKCVYTYSWDQPQETGKIKIGNDVWIGEGVRILPNVTIGDGVIVGAGSVVAKDIPPYAVVVGNPAYITRLRFTPEQIHTLENMKWWDWPDAKVNDAITYMKDIDIFLRKYEE